MKICWRMFDFFVCLRRRDGIFMSVIISSSFFRINQCSTSVGLNERRVNNSTRKTRISRVGLGFLLMPMFFRISSRDTTDLNTRKISIHRSHSVRIVWNEIDLMEEIRFKLYNNLCKNREKIHTRGPASVKLFLLRVFWMNLWVR